ncbi:MAG TPA: MFS transporter [Jiangellaceae bacterium]|nr:MFS transporter [Jiangellaceae bacterium]
MATMQQPTRPRLVTAEFVKLGAAALAYFFAVGVLLPTVPLYVEGPLGAGDIAVGFAVGSFSVSALVLRPWAGRAADRSGRRPLMVAGAAIFAVSVAAYGMADAVPVLIVLRLLTGVGEAFFFVGAVTAMSDLAPSQRRGEAISLFSLSLYVGIALGPPVGEAIAGRFGFPAAWLVASGAAVTALLLARRVGDTREHGLEHVSGERGRLIHPAGLLPGVLLLTGLWGMAGFLAFVPLYAVDHGLPGSGLLLFIFAAIVVVIRGVGARLPDRLGAVRATRAALAGITIGLAIIGTWRSPVGLVVGTVVLAVGVALATPAIMTLALQDVPATERGSVMGTVSMSLDLAFGLGPATLGIVAAATGRGGLFLVAAGVAALGLTLVVTTQRRGSH